MSHKSNTIWEETKHEAELEKEAKSENAKLVKELTGEDAEDIFGGDAENEMEELSEDKDLDEDNYMAQRDIEINAINNK